MIDYQSALYDPVYNTLGVPAVITLGGSAGTSVSLTAIDKTAGVEVSGDVNVSSIKPAAAVRMVELANNSVDRSDLNGGSIALNGATWRIDATSPRPAPTGEAEGELYLVLSRARETATSSVHALTADDVESASEVSKPSLAQDGVNALTADGTESAVEISTPSLAQDGDVLTTVSGEVLTDGSGNPLTTG